MANFTKISPYRAGPPRFGRAPGEEPPNGPVITYRLSPEEIARRYGPPTDPEKAQRIRNWQQTIRGARKKGECEVVEVAENMPENMPAPETEQPEPTGNVRKTKLELAQEALPREEFEEFIRQGFTDQQVADLKGLELYLVKRIKQKYGLVGIVERRRKPMAFEIYRGDVGSKGEKMTVARALKVREEIVADIQCVEKNIPAEMLTPGVKAALDDLVKRGKDMLERIDRALETLEIEV